MSWGLVVVAVLSGFTGRERRWRADTIGILRYFRALEQTRCFDIKLIVRVCFFETRQFD